LRGGVQDGDRIADNPQIGLYPVVRVVILGEEALRIGRGHQCIVAVRQPIHDDILAGEAALVEVRPSGRDPLVRIAVLKSRLLARCGGDPDVIDQAERLLVSTGYLLSGSVEQDEFVEVLEVIVPVTGGEDEPLRMIGGDADLEVLIPDVVREHVKPQDAMLAGGDAAILHVVADLRERLDPEEEVANDRHKVDAHGRAPFLFVAGVDRGRA
jgi:hypothetical protein